MLRGGRRVGVCGWALFGVDGRGGGEWGTSGPRLATPLDRFEPCSVLGLSWRLTSSSVSSTSFVSAGVAISNVQPAECKHQKKSTLYSTTPPTPPLMYTGIFL